MQRRISDGEANDEKDAIVFHAEMNAFERQQIFREMVVQQLRNGPLSRIRRRRIVQFAAKLGITAVLAGRLVQEAQRAQPARTSARDKSHGSQGSFAIVLGLVLINSWLILRLVG